MSQAEAHADGLEHNDMAHVASPKLLLTIFFALMVLTVVTVLAAGLGFGAIDLWVAMFIATIKATLVAVFFMHLRYDRPINTVVFLSSFLFVAVFIGFTMMDTSEYNEVVIWEEKGTENPDGGAIVAPAGEPGVEAGVEAGDDAAAGH